MKSTRRWSLALVLVLVAAPLSTLAAGPSSTNGWRLLFYVNGDSSYLARDEILESSRELSKVVERMAGHDTRSVSLGLLLDVGEGVDGLEAFELFAAPGTSATRVPLAGPCNMGDGATLRGFLEKGRALPGDKTFLYVGGHGSGAVPTHGAERVRVTRQFPFHHASLAFDESSGEDSLTLEELAASLTAYGKPVDVLVLDACHMNTLEVGYQLRDLVAFLVASSRAEAGRGMDPRFLTRLGPRVNAIDLARQARDALSSPADGSFRIVRPNRAPQVAASIDELLGVLRSRYLLAAAIPPLTAHRLSPAGSGVDIASFCAELLANRATSSHDALLACLENALLAYQVDATTPAGIAIYRPTQPLKRHRWPLIHYYEGLDMSHHHTWDDYLRLTLLEATGI